MTRSRGLAGRVQLSSTSLEVPGKACEDELVGSALGNALNDRYSYQEHWKFILSASLWRLTEPVTLIILYHLSAYPSPSC